MDKTLKLAFQEVVAAGQSLHQGLGPALFALSAADGFAQPPIMGYQFFVGRAQRLVLALADLDFDCME